MLFRSYSKSGCPNCTLVKKLIKEKHFFLDEINCDEYLLEDKEGFLKFIAEKSKKEIKCYKSKVTKQVRLSVSN